MNSCLNVLRNSGRLSLITASAILAAQAALSVAHSLPLQASDAGNPKLPASPVKAESDRYAAARSKAFAGHIASAAAAPYTADPSMSDDIAAIRVVDDFVAPQDVAVDGSGDLYVTDTRPQKVFKVTPDGHRRSVGSGFMVPQAVAVDATGNVYVADSQAGVI